MQRVTRACALVVFGLALVLGGRTAVSAAPLFEAREQISNVASRGTMVNVIEANTFAKNTMFAVTIPAATNGTMTLTNTQGMSSGSLDAIPIIAITLDALVGGGRLCCLPHLTSMANQPRKEHL